MFLHTEQWRYSGTGRSFYKQNSNLNYNYTIRALYRPYLHRGPSIANCCYCTHFCRSWYSNSANTVQYLCTVATHYLYKALDSTKPRQLKSILWWDLKTNLVKYNNLDRQKLNYSPSFKTYKVLHYSIYEFVCNMNVELCSMLSREKMITLSSWYKQSFCTFIHCTVCATGKRTDHSPCDERDIIRVRNRNLG